MKKVLLIVALVIVLALISIPLWIDSAAKSAVEAGGTQAMGVPTKLDGLSLKIFGGACSLEGLHVANPEGFESPHFLELGSGSVAVNLGSVMEDKIVIPTLTLDGIDIHLEQTLKGSNYGTILDNLKKEEQKEVEEEAPGKKFVIEELVIRNVKATAHLSLGVVKPGVPLEIEEIRMQNVGSGGEGVSMSQVFGYVLTGLLNSVAKLGKGIFPEDITKGLSSGISDLGGFSLDGVKVMGKGGEEAIAEVGKGAKEITEGLGGLLGGDKKKEKK
ncbi:MAG: hypothetical protein ACYTGV_00140 [Planctomycetota bacterium]|jgi:hypothetical protein